MTVERSKRRCFLTLTFIVKQKLLELILARITRHTKVPARFEMFKHRTNTIREQNLATGSHLSYNNF